MTTNKGVVAGAALALMLAGCNQSVSPNYTNSAGSLGNSRDDALLYAVDQDNETLTVVDTKTNAQVKTIKVGKMPERVAVGADDTIYVTNRGERSLSVIKRGDWDSQQKVTDIGIEPVGVAVAGDNKTVYVVSATAID